MNYKDSENLKQVKMETGCVPFFPLLQLLSFFSYLLIYVNLLTPQSVNNEISRKIPNFILKKF